MLSLNEDDLSEGERHEKIMLGAIGIVDLNSANPNNDVDEHKRKFYKLIAAMADQGHLDAEKLSMRKFYSLVFHLEDKANRSKQKQAQPK